MIRRFGVFDPDGVPQAFYADDLYAEADIPAEAIEITDEQWQALLSHADARFVSGQVILAVQPMEVPDGV